MQILIFLSLLMVSIGGFVLGLILNDHLLMTLSWISSVSFFLFVIFDLLAKTLKSDYQGVLMDFKKEYDEWLDEIHPLTGTSCNPFSVLLEAGDPIAYNCGYDDFLDATGKEED